MPLNQVNTVLASPSIAIPKENPTTSTTPSSPPSTTLTPQIQLYADQPPPPGFDTWDAYYKAIIRTRGPLPYSYGIEDSSLCQDDGEPEPHHPLPILLPDFSEGKPYKTNKCGFPALELEVYHHDDDDVDDGLGRRRSGSLWIRVVGDVQMAIRAAVLLNPDWYEEQGVRLLLSDDDDDGLGRRSSLWIRAVWGDLQMGIRADVLLNPEQGVKPLSSNDDDGGSGNHRVGEVVAYWVTGGDGRVLGEEEEREALRGWYGTKKFAEKKIDLEEVEEQQ